MMNQKFGLGKILKYDLLVLKWYGIEIKRKNV